LKVKNQFIYLGGYKMYLEDYLKRKHMEYCYQRGEMVSESDWVREVLNKDLPREDRLSYPSVNHWMNGGRFPDSTNIVRLIKVFGPSVLPCLGIEFAGKLAGVVNSWDRLPEESKQAIAEIVEKENAELAKAEAV
jgi:hypothetical protein